MSDAKFSRRALDGLAVEVTSMRRGAFDLGADLSALLFSARHAMHEVVVFYAARILDALVTDAVRLVRLRPSPNVFSNLVSLEQLGLIDASLAHWTHTLRRLGNDVRHLKRTVDGRDATAATLFAERCLDWYFRRLTIGPLLPRLRAEGAELLLGLDTEARSVIEALDRGEAVQLARAAALDVVLRFVPLTAVAVEQLLDAGEIEEARRVLVVALADHGDDLRLRQLLGLAQSRSGELAAACEGLEALLDQTGDDEETLGILAGAWKRRWAAEGHRRAHLQRAHELYSHGWRHSRRTSTYLGINAAATGAWLGSEDTARRVADAVYAIMAERSDAARTAGLTGGRLGVWEELTTAEAALLSGRTASARDLYQQVLHRDDLAIAVRDVAHGQLRQHLKRIAGTDDTDEFLRGSA